MIDRIDDIPIELDIDQFLVDLPALLANAGHSPSATPPPATDIADLGVELAAVANASRIAIRLEVIETDARRFHADYVTARLICTYTGAGRQWLDDSDAAKLADGADPATLTIRQVATGDVAVLKGRHWAPDRPIVHRSPPVAATGERRLVLVIDPANDAPIPHA